MWICMHITLHLRYPSSSRFNRVDVPTLHQQDQSWLVTLEKPSCAQLCLVSTGICRGAQQQWAAVILHKHISRTHAETSEDMDWSWLAGGGRVRQGGILPDCLLWAAASRVCSVGWSCLIQHHQHQHPTHFSWKICVSKQNDKPQTAWQLSLAVQLAD